MIDRTAYNKIFENGVRHIECAKLLGQNKDYGFAVSHFVLGIEELMKYQVVMTKSVNDYSFDDVIDPTRRQSVFRNHLTKHDLLKEFQESIGNDFASKFHELILLKATGQEVTSIHPDIEKNRFKEWGAFFAIAGSEMNIPESQRERFFDWLKNANDLKNKGFYANWVNNNMETPGDVTVEQYEEALSYATSILKQTEFMKSVDLSDEEFIELLNKDLPNDTSDLA